MPLHGAGMGTRMLGHSSSELQGTERQRRLAMLSSLRLDVGSSMQHAQIQELGAEEECVLQQVRACMRACVHVCKRKLAANAGRAKVAPSGAGAALWGVMSAQSEVGNCSYMLACHSTSAFLCMLLPPLQLHLPMALAPWSLPECEPCHDAGTGAGAGWWLQRMGPGVH